MDYLSLKTTHVSCVAISYVLFVARGVWMMRGSAGTRTVHAGSGQRKHPRTPVPRSPTTRRPTSPERRARLTWRARELHNLPQRP